MGKRDVYKRQEETMRNRRKTLELLGVAVRDQQEILQLASVAPMVLDTALKETWGCLLYTSYFMPVWIISGSVNINFMI